MYISNILGNTVVAGTAYADTIDNYGLNVTIYGGTGNDSINNSAFGKNLYVYDYGNGHDVISGFHY
ncbi:MAG: hypothetical protein IKD80_08110, partial [Selenomonadaceae bacterium]|nr:hypothetical protein [Selenomonadaceae bacterium]